MTLTHLRTSWLVNLLGWWECYVTCSMASTRVTALQNVQHRDRYMEFWSTTLGNIQLRKTALVSTVQPRGTVTFIVTFIVHVLSMNM